MLPRSEHDANGEGTEPGQQGPSADTQDRQEPPGNACEQIQEGERCEDGHDDQAAGDGDGEAETRALTAGSAGETDTMVDAGVASTNACREERVPVLAEGGSLSRVRERYQLRGIEDERLEPPRDNGTLVLAGRAAALVHSRHGRAWYALARLKKRARWALRGSSKSARFRGRRFECHAVLFEALPHAGVQPALDDGLAGPQRDPIGAVGVVGWRRA